MARAKIPTKVRMNLNNPNAPIKEVCSNCTYYNPKATATYKCRVPGSCPAAPPRDIKPPIKSHRMTLEEYAETLNFSHAMYHKEQLLQAFRMVMNPHGWRLPINKLVDYPGAENVDCATEAIVLITGSIPVATRCLMCDKILFKADGYNKADGCQYAKEKGKTKFRNQ